jgi:uncharacterized protein with PQ loop repeat
MNSNSTPQTQNREIFTLPEGMTREEAFERLKKNSSKCHTIKNVYIDSKKDNILIFKGKFSKCELGVIDNDATVKVQLSSLWLVPAILLLGALYLIANALVRFYTVGVPIEWVLPIFIYLIVSLIISFPLIFISLKDSKKILDYIEHELGITKG